ncbi:hypothetical protein [Nonomuraea sp. NPDC049400]|uniref:hypothetical protein n=1 Tax=Nonomuraea sp. NPDC049400 TaxID=3364352 RepID=UPI0037A00448
MSVRNDVKDVKAAARQLFDANLPVLVELAQIDEEISELTAKREQLLGQARQLFTEGWLAELGFGAAPTGRGRARRPTSSRGRSRSQKQGAASAASAAAEPAPASDGEDFAPPPTEEGAQADTSWNSSTATSSNWSG